ncbi:MAG: SDR family NAD(P)-dependent oxidoreductase, partial [Candidatus Binatia bacterium]
MKLDGSMVLLTGATGGLGHTIARGLAARGARLLLTGRRADALEPLARELGARPLS